MTRTVARKGWEAVQPPSQRATRRLEREDLYLPEKPEGDVPDLPEDPTELSDSALMSLFVQLSSWVEYAGARLAAAEVDEKWSADTLEKHKALSAVRNSTEKTVTAAKAKAFEDPEYIKAQEDKQQAFAYRRMLQPVYDMVDRRVTLLSRELTRRVGRSDRDSRAGKSGA
jgi:hypothetical protein